MASIGSSIAKTQTTVTVDTVTDEIFNVTLGAVNTEQSQVMPTDICGYLIKTRGRAELKLTHVSGESGTKYVTIPGATSYEKLNKYSGITLYFQSPQTGDVVEIVAYKI